MSTPAIRIGLIGVGGYGRMHLSAIARATEVGLCRLVAAVILPGLESATEADLRARGVRIHRSHQDMLREGGLDLIGIPCGIAEHAPLSVDSLEAGYHVLCEKPAAGSLDEAHRMQAAARASGKILSIGYQNLYTPTIRRIKELALQGRAGAGLGRLLGARSVTVWPRGADYYGRNTWAGRLRVNGKTVNDSPVQNAAAHELENMLWIAGPTERDSATPQAIYGEQYRAKDIESADTQYLRVTTREGPVLSFMATHACRETWGPRETYVFENGVIRWSGAEMGRTEVTHADGHVEVLDNGVGDIHHLSYLGLLEALRDGRLPAATIDNCIQHCACVDAFFRACPITSVTPSGEPNHRLIEGIEEVMRRMYDDDLSFSEAGAPWARPGVRTRI